jgi:glycosyltransferase involved in cell wall biosynthesis
VAWKRGKFVVTIHDVKPMLFNSDRPKRNLNTIIEKTVVPDQRVQVDHVVTVSQWSKKDIATHLSFPPERISVVPPGVADHFRPLVASEPDGGGKKYVLSVAGADRTKNLETLIEAFARLPVHLRDTHDLVLAGDLRNRPELRVRVRQLDLERHTKFPGIVTEAQLIDLYQHAVVFVFPSRYEGFGLPVLEAMACGCPVIASNTSSLPEVFGNAALSADPLDVKGFADHLEQVLIDPQCRQELRRKGLLRASMFSWEHTAGEMVKVYEKVKNT